ncbi:MAG: hypothetical protein HYV68_01020 [Candidatus Taylorbacteria bacterium]|nr:hypothetical protein [Candidatus Taylorbacteria bacterium]
MRSNLVLGTLNPHRALEAVAHVSLDFILRPPPNPPVPTDMTRYRIIFLVLEEGVCWESVASYVMHVSFDLLIV